jgi:hypothetical protein
MVCAATDDRAVGELCPISRSAHTCITRPHVENAIRIAAKALVLCAPVHVVSHALSQRNIEKSTFEALLKAIGQRPGDRDVRNKTT